MRPRFTIAATSAAAVLVGLAASVSSLIATLAHPVSAVSAERIAALFATVPFLALGVAGVALCSLTLPEPWRRTLGAAWALALVALCLLGPLAGPYGALFTSATGWPAGSWQQGWTQVAAWSGPGDLQVTLGLARLPLLAGAAACLALSAVEAVSAARSLAGLAALRHRFHLPPRRHGVRGVAP